MHNKRRTSYRRILSIALLVLLQGLGLNLTSQQQSDDQQPVAGTTNVQTQYASLPLAFEPNQGQVDGGVQYLVHHGQATTYFDGVNTTTRVGNDHITMSLDGANSPDFTGTDQLESKTNYFIGSDQSKWHSDIPNYKELLAKNVYPGIDLKYYGTNSQLEHDFIVNPGADPSQIAFHLDGQDNLSIDVDGNLILKAGGSELKLNAPTTYQSTSNSKHTVPSHFELNDNTVRIAVGNDYDSTQLLVIDPTLVYSTYLGGSALDAGDGIVIDNNSNIYVVGSTTSTNFPTASPYQGANGSGSDVFVSKFNPSGSALLYSTYFGGSGNEGGKRIAVDFAGNAYIAGTTNSTNFPTSSPFQASYGGGALDVFVSKLNASGSALAYSTYLGGSNTDGDGLSPDIAIDASGNAYVAGSTHSSNFPTLSPYQSSLSGITDSFLTKFNPSGSSLTYSTYLGGSGQEAGGRVALDASNNAYLTGNTASTDFPTSSPYQASNAGGGTDAFLAKFNTGGSALTYATYFGGTDIESAQGIAVDTTESAYITGYTFSTDLPTASAFQSTFGGNGGAYGDAFVTKFAANGSSLTYSTYLGGSDDDAGLGIALNASGNAFITGLTGSTNFPKLNPYQAAKAGGISDTFVTKLTTTGSGLVYSTYLGGNSQDQAMGIALSLDGVAYTTGFTNSTTFPTASAFQGSSAGGTDAFIAKLSENTVNVTGLIQPSLSFSIGSTTCSMGFFSATQTQYCTHTMSAGSNATGGYVISYIPTTTLTSGANTITAMSSQTASVVGSEQFGMNLKANTSAGSFTASNFGADPSGGSGTAMTGYQATDLFKFATGGGNIAQTTGSSTPTTYTVSFITNITTTSEAGTYSTPVTYNIVASY